MSEVKDTETQAVREMAAAAKRGNGVRIAQWREADPVGRIWACGWYTERDPDSMHVVGRRRTEPEIAELVASAAKLFSDIVKPNKLLVNGPANTN